MNLAEKLFLQFFRIIPRKQDDFKIIMGGLPEVGKTSVFFQLAYKARATPVPTLAFNKQIFKHRSRWIHLWDLGGHVTRKYWIWDNFAVGAKGMIFVADSSSKSELSISKEELDRLLKLETTKGIPLLVYANKIDQKQMEPIEMARALELFQIKDREWFLQPCNALDRSGVFEGFDWLVAEIRKRDSTGQESAKEKETNSSEV